MVSRVANVLAVCKAIAEAGSTRARTLWRQEILCLRGLGQVGHVELQLVRPGSLTCQD